MVVCLIFERMLRIGFLYLCIYLLYEVCYSIFFCENILSYKWYANDILFYVCNVKFLFKWFI